MKKWIFTAVIATMLGWGIYEYVATSSEKNDQEVAERTKVEEKDELGNRNGYLAYDFELETLDGEKVKLSDYKGKKVMLNFWATWCPPCRAEMPDMEKFQKAKDVTVLAVNLTETETNMTIVQDFIDKYELTFTVPLDDVSAVSNQYEIMAYPTTFMIDTKGRIQFTMMGAMNYDMMVRQYELLE